MNEQVGVTGRPGAGLCDGFVSVRGRGAVDGGGDGVVVGGAGCTRLVTSSVWPVRRDCGRRVSFITTRALRYCGSRLLNYGIVLSLLRLLFLFFFHLRLIIFFIMIIISSAV